jgi:hypothetical protein
VAQSPYADAPDAVSRSSPISRVLKRDTCGRNTRGPLRPLRAHVAHVAPERGGRSRPTSLEAWHNVARPSLRRPFEKHWGDSGGTPADKDGEIRARMGKSRFQPWVGRGAATGVFGRGCVETKGFELAPQVGLEPTTLRLTAECSTIELLRSGLAVVFAITADALRPCQMLSRGRAPSALDSPKSPVIGSWGLAASEPSSWRSKP